MQKRKTAAKKSSKAKSTPAKRRTLRKKKRVARRTKKKAIRKVRRVRRYAKAASRNVQRVVREMNRGELKSGRSGKKVTSSKQAIAIALDEARRSGKKVPAKPVIGHRKPR